MNRIKTIFRILKKLYQYLRDIWECAKDSLRLTGQIFILIAMSQVFSQALAVAQIPMLVEHALSGLNVISFFILLNLILLVIGCFFEPTSAILILAPVVLPLANVLGVSPIHLGIVFTVNLAIGMFTPPFGLNLFVMQSIFKKPIDVLGRAIVPYFCVYFVALIIITYFPQLYLWIV